MPAFGDYQNEIYFKGLRGVKPKLPVNFRLLEQKARAALPDDVLSYVAGGCGDERTQELERRRVRALGSDPAHDGRLFEAGHERRAVRLPLAVAPCSWRRSAFSASARRTAMAISPRRRRRRSPACRWSPRRFPTIRWKRSPRISGAGPGSFSSTRRTTSRSPKASCIAPRRRDSRAIVVTLDTWVLGWRPRDLNDGNFPQLRGHALANYFSDPRFRALLAKPPEEDGAAAVMQWARIFGKTADLGRPAVAARA